MMLALDLRNCVYVQDLTPLQGMPLTELILSSNKVTDLAPLKGMPLTSLNIDECTGVRDLSPLEGMQLRDITLAPNQFSKENLSVLRRIKTLQRLRFSNDQPLPAEEFWKKYDAGEFDEEAGRRHDKAASGA